VQCAVSAKRPGRSLMDKPHGFTATALPRARAGARRYAPLPTTSIMASDGNGICIHSADSRLRRSSSQLTASDRASLEDTFFLGPQGLKANSCDQEGVV